MKGQQYGFENMKKVGKYKIKGQIGKGSEGKIYLVEYKNKEYAMKEIMIDLKINDNIYKNIKPNENLVQFIEAFTEKGNQYQIFEYCNGGNLTSKLQKEKFSQHSIVLLLRQICNGYKELLRNNIIHRDIKPDNIIFQNDQAKIADFGFARFVVDPHQMQEQTAKCTPLYAAPQIFNQYFSAKCDIWSLGLILYQLIFGQLPNSFVKNFDDLFVFHRQVKDGKLNFPYTEKKELRNLTQLMTQYEEKDRIDWNTLFTHPFITGVEEQRIGLLFGTQAFYAQRYFENKVEQFRFFLQMLKSFDDSNQQIIVLTLWSKYILHITAQINGTVLMESIVESQIFYTKTPHCQRLKQIIAKNKELIEKQIQIHYYYNRNKYFMEQKAEDNQQQFQETGQLIQQLQCDQINKDQILYLINN